MTQVNDAELDVYVKAALGRKARDLVFLDVGGLTSLADAFLICHGTSNRQVTAIAEHIQIEMKKQGVAALSVDGLKEGHWVLMDYGDVVIHVFFKETRQRYNLEGLWSDARRIRTESMQQEAELSDDGTGGVDESVFIE